MTEGSPGASRSPQAGGVREDRWIETGRGGLFFVNALLIFPPFMVLFPLVLRIVVRARGGAPGPSEMLDTFPAVAEHLLPRLGWLLVVPVALILYNLRIEPAPGPRLALRAFLLLHLAALGWMVAVWTGIVDGTLPGGP